ncbi:hypothetical protein ACSNOI_24515 [Actinomadura kijaniata]|uniref:hypothetical protein n=1 Tax=Actinomadura kijaniata TaxID=46161 RepID=UPI003F1AD489
MLEGRPVAVSVHGDLRIWDLVARQQTDEPLRVHDSVIWSVACGVLHERPIALTGSDDHNRVGVGSGRTPTGRRTFTRHLPQHALAQRVGVVGQQRGDHGAWIVPVGVFRGWLVCGR